jgi:predicted nucleic acid-binding protein
MIVTDASFLVTALADDTVDGVRARDRLRDEELVAPHLVDLEVTSVLRRRAIFGDITAQRADQAFRDLANLSIEYVAHNTLLSRVWELRSNYTAYDASYVAIAELFHAPLATRDAKMAAAPGARCQFEVF